FFSVQNSTTIKDNAEAQRIYFNTGIEGHPEIAPRAIPLVKDLLAENQASGFQTTQNAIEGSSLSDEDKIKYGKMLGNQVEFLDKSAQLEAHTSLTKSQFHEVAAYAAGNIYRYDASVQSGAIDVSFAAAQSTGNTAIYEAIAQHYSQLAPETQSHIESNPSYYTPLHELAGVRAAEDKSLYTEWHDNQNKEFWYDKERHESAKEKFFREWQELTPAQKYERMCNFFKHKTKFALASKNLRSIMFSYAKSDPVFLKALVQSLGVSILECSDLPTEVRSMAAKVLMQDPAQRKSVAQKVLDAGPGVYNNSLIKYCAEYLAKQDDNITNIQSFNNLSTLQKTEVLKNSGNNNPSDEMTYVGIGTQRGSDKNNRPYLSNDFFKKKANLRELEEWIKNGI
ncbi:MAG: hypothetical protein II085_00460, partial [Alphaproteobacteria bacterium]|nr:hypothetical protein [Alphaproteobacteria bacterium]